MTPEYRILIPAKGNSTRAPGKNIELLPFTLDYVEHLERMNHCWVMTDCETLAGMAEARGASVLWEEQVGNDFCMNFSKTCTNASWADSQAVAILEPTKPFRQAWLLDACINAHQQSGKTVATGLTEAVTYVGWNGATACRHAGMQVLDACILVARCMDFRHAENMNNFWHAREVEVVWHDAPTGIDFDWPVDMETHLPTVQRLIRHGIYGF